MPAASRHGMPPLARECEVCDHPKFASRVSPMLAGLTVTAPEATIIAALIAGLLGGVLGNVVKAALDERSGNRRLRFERELTRQERIIQAQVDLLETLTSSVWEWRYCAVRLAYEGASSIDGAPPDSLKQYRDQRWAELHALRTYASRARRLMTDDAYRSVIGLYDQAVEYDRRLEAASANADAVRRMLLFSDINQELITEATDRIENVLLVLSREFKLVAQAAAKGSEK